VSGRLLEGRERVRDLRVELDERCFVIRCHSGNDTRWAAATLQGVGELGETAYLQIRSLAGHTSGPTAPCADRFL
jgi:hypothetical protein